MNYNPLFHRYHLQPLSTNIIVFSLYFADRSPKDESFGHACIDAESQNFPPREARRSLSEIPVQCIPFVDKEDEAQKADILVLCHTATQKHLWSQKPRLLILSSFLLCEKSSLQNRVFRSWITTLNAQVDFLVYCDKHNFLNFFLIGKMGTVKLCGPSERRYLLRMAPGG